MSLTVSGFTVLYCAGTILKITAGSSEKHSDKGRLNCDLGLLIRLDCRSKGKEDIIVSDMHPRPESGSALLTPRS